MPNSWFQFQQFRIHQDRCAMKISTDAVLLGGLATSEDPKRILDVGTGTGVIALMLAQRHDSAQLTAVELDEAAAFQAGENFSTSKFAERIDLWQGFFQDFKSDPIFDLIVSNPPYFPDHLKSKNSQRNQALHTDSLSFEELISKVKGLLTKSGKFWVILPERQMKDFAIQSEREGLYPDQSFILRDRPNKKVIRKIISFSFLKSATVQHEIFIKNEDGTPHESYKSIVKGFLLEFR
ncbi:methyltransferase [Algoriphagus aestuarii]|nr:methyltransferase [Algoriphagus aestuarii]